MDKTPKELFLERQTRIDEAIDLKVPDRVPILVDLGLLAARYAGISVKQTYDDPEDWAMGFRRTVADFEPDIFHCAPYGSSGAWEAVDTKVWKWPGHGGPEGHIHQFVEKEYMKADEYDAFIEDPGDFILRRYLPRTCGALAPLQALPHLVRFYSVASGAGPLQQFGDPEFWAAVESLHKAGLEARRWNTSRISLIKEMSELGFPAMEHRAVVQVPYDFIGDHLRGSQGVMIDMFRQPDKLLVAIERLVPIQIRILREWASTLPKPTKVGHTLLMWGPHKGAEGWMSPKQFETFYWPGFKAIIQAIIDVGITPYLFLEGDYTSRLEYFLELPKGKVICRLDRTDAFKAKEVLGVHQCIAGGVPSTLLQVGTVREVMDHCKKLIDVVGKDGGYIMSHSCALDEAKPENVKAMIDFTKKYGVYRA